MCIINHVTFQNLNHIWDQNVRLLGFFITLNNNKQLRIYQQFSNKRQKNTNAQQFINNATTSVTQ